MDDGHRCLKPGWARVNFNYFIEDIEAAFVMRAILQVRIKENKPLSQVRIKEKKILLQIHIKEDNHYCGSFHVRMKEKKTPIVTVFIECDRLNE